MDKAREKELEYLLSLFDRIAELDARVQELNIKRETEEEEETRELISEELLPHLEELIRLTEEKSPTKFVKLILLSLLQSIIRSKEKEEFKASLDIAKEIVTLEIFTNRAIELLETELNDIQTDGFINFVMLLVEIGKRTPIMTSLTGYEFGMADLLKSSTYQDIQKILHAKKSAEGGRKKAERQRETKLERIKPFLEELKKIRISGKFKRCGAAVHALLEDQRFNCLYEDMENGEISFDNFLMPEAKKTWDSAVRPSKSK